MYCNYIPKSGTAQVNNFEKNCTKMNKKII